MFRVDAIFIFILSSRHDTHHEHISINQQKQTGYYLSTEKKHKKITTNIYSQPRFV